MVQSQPQPTLAQNIGRRIAQRRKEMGLTQEQAAERAGLSAQFFACVERGLKNIRAESLLRVSRALEVSADYLLTGRPTDHDRSLLAQLAAPLDAVQLHCLEEIVRQYRVACGLPLQAEEQPAAEK